MDVNPYTTGISAMPPFLMKSEFHPDGVYRINIDSDGDAQADAAFTFTFSDLRDGAQTVLVYYATGTQARQPEPAGELLISATPVGFDAAAQPVQAGPAGCSPGSAATRSSPMRTAPSTALSGPGRTRSPTATCRHRPGGAQRHARRRPGDRPVGDGQRAP